MTNLIQYIKEEIVVPSGEAIGFCMKSQNCTEDAARKRIQRLPDDIYKIKGICRDGQSILYARENWGNELFYDKLLDVLKENATQYYLIINALRLHFGAISTYRMASYSVSPVIKVKGHKLFETIMDGLKNLGLVQESDEQYKASGYYGTIESKSKAINTIQDIVFHQFHEWARNIGLFSYDSAKFDSNFSGYQFGLVAPSYLKSLTGKSSKTPGSIVPAFVVADILLNRDISKDDVLFFIKKVQNISMQKQQARFIPFLIIGSHDAEIYKELKTNGIVIGNIDELFGAKYSEIIYEIFNLINNAGAILKNNPDHFLKLLSEIEKYAIGKTFNLKGALFEMSVGFFHRQYCQSIDISKDILFESESKEIDVFAVYQDKVVFAECKGYNSPINDTYVEEWISKRIPFFRKWALSCDSICNKHLEFEIWCTGGFTEDSSKKLEKAKQRTHKYSIEFFDIPKMRSLAKTMNVPRFKEIIDEYYTK